MSKELTGYNLSRNWFDFCFDNPEKIKPTHTAIYMFALEHWNRLGQKKKFGFPSQMTMDAVGIKSYNTYIPAFNDLVQWGFFELIEKSKNQYSSNIIALSNIDNATDNALDKAMIKHKVKHLQSKCSIDKQTNKEQYNHSSFIITDDVPVKNGKECIYSFSDFWDLYDKKKERKKCEHKWNGISEKDKKKIMEFIPIYKESNSEKYLKYPYSFLNSEIWNDDWDYYKKTNQKIKAEYYI